MKKLGLIGGTGPESTLLYYKRINDAVCKKTAGKAFPEIIIESLDMCKALDHIERKDYEGLSEYVNERIINLINSGAEVISLTAVTMHIIYDRLTELSPMLPVSIPQTVSKETLKRGYKCVGLLGTSFTMENDYMKKPFEEKGIRVIVPEERDRKLVADRIANELEYGIVKESTLRELCGVINRMAEKQGIEAVILGCTELPLILDSEVCPIECLDAVEIHINKLIELIDA